MDAQNDNCSTGIIAEADCPVWCSEEVLLPVFTDESQPVAMESHHYLASPSTPPALPELRLVLLGRKGAGKSAAGNIILEGVGGFESGRPTEVCVRRRGDVAGRRVTVVDTPGWEWYYTLNGTPNWVRRETLRSVSLCPFGPHAVLLVVRSCASVTEDYIREMEAHLEPLGKGIWEYSMLLFTKGDELGLVSMEQRILSGGPALQRLLQRCGNRYHVVDNRSKGDGTKIIELLRKLEEMVEEKKDRCSYLEMDSTILLGPEADGKRRARERRKKQRETEEQMQRMTIKAAVMSDGVQSSDLDAHKVFSKFPQCLPEIRLVLVGERETGKSSAGNAILGQTDFFNVGAVTEECIRQQAEVAMWLVTVVDTPGWEGGVAGATPERVKREIVTSVTLCPPGPHMLLLTLRVDTLVTVGHVREHLELLGEGVWRHTLLLFTHGDQLREGVDIEQHIQGGGRDLQWLLEKCSGRYHVISSINGGGHRHNITELLQKVEKMAVMNRCEAFSGLVQEVRDLSQQRNEGFNQCLKEMGNKMLRQETELRTMREREIKSIRWFFDRKKNLKSLKKANIQREGEEADEDKRIGESKTNIGELEERIRWLTEDKDREIQDMSIEKERICVTLHRSSKELEKAMLLLEQKEREIEELKEGVEEQQIKLLDLERASVKNEHVRKQREESIKVRKEEWMREFKKLGDRADQEKKDKAEWMEKVVSLEREMDETKRHFENIMKTEAQEKDREITEVEEKLKSEMQIKLLEKKKELDEMKKNATEEKQATFNYAKQYETDMEGRVEEMRSRHKEEMERQTHEKEKEIRDLKLQHQEDVNRKIYEIENRTFQYQKEIQDIVAEKERIKKCHDKEKSDMDQERQRKIAELKREFANETKKQLQEKDREIDELERRHFVQMEGNMLEFEEEMEMIKRDIRQKMEEKEKQLEVLQLQHQEEMARKIEEIESLTERNVKQNERDVEKVREECSDKMRTVEEEKQREIIELKRQFAEENEKHLQETKIMLRELEQSYDAKIKENTLENENEKELMIKNLEKCNSEKMQEKDRLIQVLQYEIKQNMQEYDKEKESTVVNIKKEMEQKLEEKVQEIEEMTRSVREMREKLQMKEKREIVDSKDRKQTEQRLEEREREIEFIKEHLKELELKLRQTEEEREIDDLRYRKQMEEKDREIEELQLIEKLQIRKSVNKETDYLNGNKNIKLRPEGREREIQTMKERLHQTEAERDHLNQNKEMEQKLEEKERQVEKLSQHIKYMNDREGERGEIILKQKQEAEETLQDIEKEMEGKLREKEREIAHIKQQAKSRETEWREEQREREDGVEIEMNRLKEIIDMKTNEIVEAQSLLVERDSEIDETKQTHANFLEEIEALKESNMNQISKIMEIQQRHAEQENERMKNLQKKEAELCQLRRRDGENEKELSQLRLTIEQTKSELKELTDKMEREMINMIEEYEREIAKCKENLESFAKEKDSAIGHLEEESQQSISEVTEKYEKGLKIIEMLQGQNKEMKKEADVLLMKTEELQRKREVEVRKRFEGYEHQVKSIEAEIQNIVKERDMEVRGLKEANEKLQAEIELISKTEGEVDEMRQDLQRPVEEKESELRVKYQEIKQELLKRRIAVKVSGLDAKQEELAKKEIKEEEEEFDDGNASLEDQPKWPDDKYEQEQHIKTKEMELESFLRLLEGKQKELSYHGEDLRKKVKGLRDQGKELKDLEYRLKNEEQELLNWKSELQMQNENVNSTTHQLNVMGRELALLKVELQSREKNLRVSFEKLSIWEKSLKEREEELLKRDFRQHKVQDKDRDCFDLAGAVVSEVEGKEEKGRGRAADRRDNADDGENQGTKKARSAAESYNHHFEILKLMKFAADKESTKEIGEETRKTKEREDVGKSEVSQEIQFLTTAQGHRCSNNKESAGSDLRVLILGELWSSRFPVGVTILSGEVSKDDGSRFRHWRGQLAGQHLAVVEPMGLRWRDGPDPSNTLQRQSILDSISWCHPGPQVVLLFIPAFLTCTLKYRRAVEEHMRLLGEEIWQSTLVLLTWGEILGESAEQHILRNGELKRLVERCGGRYHVAGSKKNISMIGGLFEKIKNMMALNGVRTCV